MGTLLICFLGVLLVSRAEAQRALRRIRQIPLPEVEGRIDHMDLDASGQRLFVAARGNNSVEVVDLKQRKVVRSINNLDEPQGICYIPKSNSIVVASGGDGSVRIFDGSSFAEVKRIKLSEDADNVRYDSLMNAIYVGYGDGALGIIDASTFKELGRISLPAHPESFQLDGDGSRIFVNVPAAKQIVVLDTRSQKQISSIALKDESANFPMALDHENHLLFVGFRKPSRLLVIDATSQRILSRVDIDGDADDIFYDQRSMRIYISCGSGFLDVIERSDSSQYKVASRVKTASGARTCLFIPQLNRLFLAVPHRGEKGAAVWVYEVKQ